MNGTNKDKPEAKSSTNGNGHNNNKVDKIPDTYHFYGKNNNPSNVRFKRFDWIVLKFKIFVHNHKH